MRVSGLANIHIEGEHMGYRLKTVHIACLMVLLTTSVSFAQRLPWADSGDKRTRELERNLEQQQLEKAIEEGRKREQALKQEISTAKVAQLKFIERAKETNELLSQAELEIKRWAEQIEPLLKNETGKKIASNKDYVLTFIRAYDAEHPSASNVENAKKKVAILLAPVEAFYSDQNSAARPSRESEEGLTSLHSWAAQTLKSYREDRETIEGLTLSAQTAQNQDTTSSMTLEQAVKVQKSLLAIEAAKREEIRQKQIWQTEQEARDEAAKRLAEQKKESAELVAKQQVEIEQQQRALQLEQAEKEAAKSRLEAEAMHKQTLWDFGIYLGKGLTSVRIMSGKRIYWRVKDENRPSFLMSYSSLSRILADSNLFGKVSCASKPDRLGAPWPCPKSDADYEFVKNRLKLFHKYAPIWIAKGKLAQ